MRVDRRKRGPERTSALVTTVISFLNSLASWSLFPASLLEEGGPSAEEVPGVTFFFSLFFQIELSSEAAPDV